MAAIAAAHKSLTSAALADTAVKDPWIRGTVVRQPATGMFAQITSSKGGRLVAASSPVANVVEIHEMALVDNVMKMRAVAGLDLPAGAAMDLKPGGFHVMLIDLKQQLKQGDIVPVTLVIEDMGAKREAVVVQAPVRGLASGHDPVKH